MDHLQNVPLSCKFIKAKHMNAILLRMLRPLRSTLSASYQLILLLGRGKIKYLDWVMIFCVVSVKYGFDKICKTVLFLSLLTAHSSHSLSEPFSSEFEYKNFEDIDL